MRNKKEENKSKSSKATLTLAACQNCVILLPTAVVKVRIRNKKILARVLIDVCSQVNLVTSSFAKKHSLDKQIFQTTITGVAPGNYNSPATAKLHLISRFNKFTLNLDAEVVTRIPYNTSSKVMMRIKEMTKIPLAEQNLETTGTVDILIGGQYANQILSGNKRFIGKLCLEQTRFGWVMQGPLNTNPTRHELCCHLNVRVDQILAIFWEIEEISAPHKNQSEAELYAKYISKST